MYLTDTRVSFSSDCKRITHVQTLILIALYSSKVSSGSALALSAKARAIKPLLWPLTFLLHLCSSIKLTARRVSHTFATKTVDILPRCPLIAWVPTLGTSSQSETVLTDGGGIRGMLDQLRTLLSRLAHTFVSFPPSTREQQRNALTNQISGLK